MKKRRLVFSGYPCPVTSWQKYMPKDCEQRFVTLAEALQAVGKPDFKLLSRFALEQITSFGPTSIVCHDYAVTYTLMALLYAKKKGIKLAASVTIFNGVFRGFDVLRAPHPFYFQWISWGQFVEFAAKAGGEIDPQFRKLNPLVRALYRGLILLSLKEKVEGLFRSRKPLGLDLGIPAQIIASPHDPFIPFEVRKF